ncbi:BMP family ABC transporter substrate-binding protein [[Mycoplasma] collis]|uniref:BMP family ABC transporter substrate-binding protein n=1 Tax=[Mycoplasma] collis TaxID=2127 RepID=UPI00051C172E|nr:BMP family ABC transporter substrate-binding protein [[Mycoplasma] collis]
MKKKNLLNKKILLTLGSLASIATIATVVSCGTDKKVEKPTTNVAGITELVNSSSQAIKTASQDETKHNKLKIKLITAAGSVDDNSFNQSIYEAIRNFAALANSKESEAGYFNATSDEKLHDAYDKLLTEDINVWVLSGFTHGLPGTGFLNWLKKENNKSKFDNKKIIVVGVDWNLPPNDTSMRPGSFISLMYKTNEAAWVAGYAAAKYLTDTETDASKRTLATFGGGSKAGVTDFIAGFLGGIYSWNQDNTNNKVKLSHETLDLDIGFDLKASDKITKVNNIVATNKPKIILPVSGPFTDIVLEAIKKNNIDQLVIGVDTDQSKEYIANSDKFFTSIEKRLGSTVFRVLRDLYLKENLPSDSLINEFNSNSKNLTIFEGINKQAVDVSDNSFKDIQKKNKAQEALNYAKEKFIELTKNNSNLNIIDVFIGATDDQVSKLNELVKKINNESN